VLSGTPTSSRARPQSVTRDTAGRCDHTIPDRRLAREIRHYTQVGFLDRVTTVTDAMGGTTSAHYDANGNLLSTVDPNNVTQAATPLQFTGRENDGPTGLYYYRTRYYSPQLGRFISEDPTGVGAGTNFYAYVNGDPVDNADPTGKLGFPGAIGGAAFNFAAQMATQLYKNGGHFGAAFECVNFTNVIVAFVAGAVLPGFVGVGKSLGGFAAGTESGLQFGSNAFLWGLVGMPYKTALDLSLPPLTIAGDCACKSGNSSASPADHVY